MIQLSFDFELLPLANIARKVKPVVTGSTQAGIKMTLQIAGEMVTAIIPDWMIGRDLGFIKNRVSLRQKITGCAA